MKDTDGDRQWEVKDHGQRMECNSNQPTVQFYLCKI